MSPSFTVWLKSGRLGQRYRRLLGVGVPLVLLALYLSALPLQAAGSDIRVLSDWQETEFPGDVVFNLAVEGEQELVEVRLYYRIAGSGAWAYSYATFQPGRRINASLNLSTDGAGYLPPGTDLEYYYSIRDATGNVHETPHAIFEHVDNRFTWKKTRAGPLTLLHHDVPQSQVAVVAREVESELRRIGQLLQINLDQPIKGVIYNRRAEALEALPFQSRTITEAHIFQGFAFPFNGVFVGVGLEPRLIVHESAHLLLHQALGSGARLVPSWLDEGLASYVEPGSAPSSGRSLSSLGLPLRTMTRVPGSIPAIRTFYQKSESVVAYLIEEYGDDSFRQFLAEVRQRRTTDDALVRTYGFDVDGLERRWATNSAVADAPAPGAPDRPSFFVNFDTLIIGGLVLAVMAAFLARYVVSKLRPTPNPEEGLQPWEDPARWDSYIDDEYADDEGEARPP